MAVKAQWFVPPLAADEEDPFADEPDEDVTRTGVPIDLSDGPARLERQLVALLADEEALRERGVTCPVKDRADTCCHACPLRGARRAPRELCNVGLAQERIVGHLAVRHAG